MNNSSIKPHTKEEVEEFVKLLKEAFEDKSKIDEVLSFENTSLLQTYLLNMGVNPELLEYAAVVEYVREDLRKVLTNAQKCNITEKGIDSIYYYYSKEGSQIKAQNDGGILLSLGEIVNNPGEMGEVLIRGSGLTMTMINRFGAVEFQGYNRIVMGEFYGVTRDGDKEGPVVIEESTDGASFGYEEEMEDYGHPLEPANQDCDFKENYELFSKLYPRLQGWYELYFPMYNKTVEEYSNMLKEKTLDREIKELECSINDYQTAYVKKVGEITEMSFKVGKMIGFIKTMKDKSPIGKKAAKKILDKVKKIKRPQKEQEIEDENIPENETKEQKKARLQRKLKSLKGKYNQATDKDEYLNKVIMTIEKELDKIPLIGGIVNRAAENYKGRRVDIDDDEPIV